MYLCTEFNWVLPGSFRPQHIVVLNQQIMVWVLSPVQNFKPQFDPDKASPRQCQMLPSIHNDMPASSSSTCHVSGPSPLLSEQFQDASALLLSSRMAPKASERGCSLGVLKCLQNLAYSPTPKCYCGNPFSVHFCTHAFEGTSLCRCAILCRYQAGEIWGIELELANISCTDMSLFPRLQSCNLIPGI